MGRVKNQIGNCIKGCNKLKHSRDLCKTCYRKLHYEEHERERRGNQKHIKHSLLTIQTDVDGYQRIKIGEGNGAKDWQKYHRYVIEQHIGRKLHSFENVHHINGSRSDNRLENLELWVTKQPKGQRPDDLVEYAKWILKTYKNV
jgi:hypothetical protein